MAASAESKNYVQKMFIAFLGRAAAPDGLEYWGSAIDADAEGGKAALFDSLWNSAQAVSIYGGLETYQIVNLIFNNLFGRDPEIPGLLYWTNAIDDGDVNVLEAAAAIADAGAQDADGLASINAKTQAADAITAELEADPSLVAGYTSDENFALARNSLGDVTAANVGTFDAATETANVAAGYSANVTLSTGAETVTGTAGFTDVVTGVVGTGATYSAANTITDPDTTDSDILNLSGDAGFTFGTVTNFEAVNISLTDTVGSGFTIAGANNVTGATINVDVADTVTVVGVELQGETVVSVTGALSSDLSTTDVTDLTATAGGGAISITGDVDLAAIAVGEIADDGTTITLANTAAAVNLDGTAATNDTATISAAGTVTLDAGTTDEVEELTLSGNGAAVTYAISNVTGSAATFTADGDQDVTLSGAASVFDDSSFSDTSTGATSLNISTAGDANVAEWGVVSGGIELSDDFSGNTVSAASGNTISVTATQTGPLTIDANDTAGGTLEVSVGAALDDLVIGDFATATILTGNSAATMVDLTANAVAGNNDVDVTVAGTAAVAFTGAVATADLTIGGNTDVQFASADVNGVLDVTGSGAVTATGAINAENDALITGDSVTLVSTVDVSSAGAMTITSTGNDVTLSAAATNASGDITVSSAGVATVNAVTATSGNIDITATGSAAATGAVDASNDVSITGDSVTFTSTVDVSSAGTMTITSTGNDVTVSGAASNAAGDINITSAGAGAINAAVAATAGSVTIGAAGATTVTTAAISADNDVTITGDSVTTVGVSTVAVATAGTLAITSTANDVTLADGLTNASGDIAVTSAGAAAVEAVTATSGNIDITAAGAATITGAVDASNDVSITGDSVAFTSTVDVSSAGTMTITSTGNDVTVSGAASNAAGGITITSAGAGAINAAVAATAGSVTIGAAGATTVTTAAISADNDVTITGDSVTTVGVSTVAVATAGTLAITSTANDVTLADGLTNASGDIAVTSAGAATVEAVTATSGNIDITATGAALATAAVDASNDVSITGDSVALSGTVDVSSAGTMTITSTGNDVTVSGAAGNAAGGITITSAGDAAINAAVTATAGSVTLTATGDVAATGTITADNDVSVTGDDVTVDDLVSSNTGNIVITGTNDVLTVGSITNTAGDGSVTISTGGAISLTAGEAIGATNDVTITSTASGVFTQNDVTIDATAGDISLTAGTMTGTGAITATAGDITLNMTNDSAAQSSLGVVDATAGGVSIVDGDFAITEVGANDAAGGGLTISGTADATITTASLINSGLYLTTANDVAITTLDTAVVAGGGTGNYDLGTVASSAAATVQITTGAGDDTMTLDSNGGDDKFLVSTGDGADTVTAEETETGTVVNLGEGDDTFAPTAGGFVGTAVMGNGSDTLSLDDGGDYSGDGLVTGVEIISLEGTTAVTISYDQFAGEDSFEVQGASGTIIIDGSGETVATLDLSNVTHQAGNQTGFTLTGGTGNDTITGAARDDTITGGQGADTLTGGAGDDNFTYTNTNEGGDTIVDFDSGADTFQLKSTVFQVGMAGAIATAASDTAFQSAVFSGTDLSVFLSGNSATFSAATGAYGLIFIDTSGTDAGVYYVTGTVGAAATVAAAATGVTSNIVTIALTGSNSVAAGDFYIF